MVPVLARFMWRPAASEIVRCGTSAALDSSFPMDHPSGRLYKVLAFAATIICLLIVVYIVLGHPGIETPAIVP